MSNSKKELNPSLLTEDLQDSSLTLLPHEGLQETVQINQVNTWLTYVYDEPKTFEDVDSYSETVPDMVPDLRLLLDRSSQGIPVPTRNDGYSEDDYPDIFKMDEFELAQFREDLADQMTRLDEELHVSSKKLEELEKLRLERENELLRANAEEAVQKKAEKSAKA